MNSALVTGASRGIGKGIAVELARAGYRVYLTGRAPSNPRRAASVHSTAAEIHAMGAEAIALDCDHSDDAQTAAVFKRIIDEEGSLDVLVNNATAFGSTPDGYPLDDVPFWQHPIALWDAMHTVGLRSHFVASSLAAPAMIKGGKGLILNVSSAGATQYVFNAAYGAQKAALDKLTADMAHDLEGLGVTAISLWPPFTRTEKYEAMAERINLAAAKSPSFTGRVVAALASDSRLQEKSGKAFRVTDLAQEYGILE
jgi:dehydrogenase/reductase SDR family protein 1